jgi:two-component system sensor kinase FixL
MPDLGKVRRAMELAGNQALRAGEIINRVRKLMAKGEVERRIENAAEILQEAAALALATATGKGVIARLSFETSARILVDKIQIQQVLFNLVRNAVEAMEESPRKVIEIRAVETSGSVETSVSDTGIGLPAEIADRLFEPFSSTKSQGMGIGLHLCRNIVAAHDGRIWAEPRSGGGSVFRFTIPIADPVLRADPGEKPRAAAVG